MCFFPSTSLDLARPRTQAPFFFPQKNTQLVRQLLAKGNRVHATARTVPCPGLDALSKAAAPGKLTVRSCDVSSASSISAWADGLAEDLKAVGAPGLSLVIHNAGVAIWDGIEDLDAAKMEEVFRVNTIGPLLTTQALLKTGAIGNKRVPCTAAYMTSKMGSVSDNGSGGTYSYRASKAALNIAVKSLSIDLGPRGVTATLLHPGYVRTDMTRGNGLIDVDQCASGLLGVLEAGAAGEIDLRGTWHDYKREAIPW